MNIARRALAWAQDYAYVTYWQLRHALGNHDASSYLAGAGSPVLLLPGVYETWQFLRPVADHVHQDDHPVHVVPGFGYNVRSVPEMAALARDYLLEHDLTDVLVVAHSKGGLIGKHLMVVDGVAPRIRGMVAVCTPFAGSIYARWLPFRTLRDFSPREKTLLLLSANAEANARITSVFPVFDPHIPGGSRLAGARNVQLDIGGHFRTLAAPQVIEEVDRALARAPGPGDDDGGAPGPGDDAGAPGPGDDDGAAPGAA